VEIAASVAVGGILTVRVNGPREVGFRSKDFILIHVPRTAGALLEAGSSHCGIVLQRASNFDRVHFKHAYA
jgi:hypothetical protein